MHIEDFSLYRGDTHVFDVVLVDEHDIAIDLLGAEVLMAVKPVTGDTIYPDLQIEGNVIHIIFNHELTKNLTWRTAKYDLQIQQAGITTTIMRGKVVLEQDITV